MGDHTVGNNQESRRGTCQKKRQQRAEGFVEKHLAGLRCPQSEPAQSSLCTLWCSRGPFPCQHQHRAQGCPSWSLIPALPRFHLDQAVAGEVEQGPPGSTRAAPRQPARSLPRRSWSTQPHACRCAWWVLCLAGDRNTWLLLTGSTASEQAC